MTTTWYEMVLQHRYPNATMERSFESNDFVFRIPMKELMQHERDEAFRRVLHIADRKPKKRLHWGKRK